VRTFNRYELKYVVKVDKLANIRRSLEGRLEPDRFATNGKYVLTSLYYDSPDLVCFWAKVDGESRRRKVRIRVYESREPLNLESPVYVEIKQRVNRTTQKRRLKATYGEALQLCSGVRLDRDDVRDQRVADEVFDLAHRFDLRPTAITSYQREAWEGGWMDRGVRVTFDTDLRSRTSQLDLSSRTAGTTLMPPGLAIVEIKVNERVPGWLVRTVAMHDMRVETISKYCRAVEISPLLRLTDARKVAIHRPRPATPNDALEEHQP
jgi:VTC domain